MSTTWHDVRALSSSPMCYVEHYGQWGQSSSLVAALM